VRATDVVSTSLFIFAPFLANCLTVINIPSISPAEVFGEPAVERCMKTKHLFGLLAVVAVAGFTASAQAGWSVNVSIPLPLPCYSPVAYYPAPVTYCAPPVVYYPPRSVYYAPVVYAPSYRSYGGHGNYYRPSYSHGGRGYGHGNRSGGHR